MPAQMNPPSSSKRKSKIPQKRGISSDSNAHLYHPIPVDDLALNLDTQSNNPGLKQKGVIEKMPKNNKQADIMKNITDDDDAVVATGQFIESRIDTSSNRNKNDTNTNALSGLLESHDRVTGTKEEIVEILASVNDTVPSASDIPVPQEGGGGLLTTKTINNGSGESHNLKIENAECGNYDQFITKDEIYQDIFPNRSHDNNSPYIDFSDDSFDCELLFVKVPKRKLQDKTFMNNIYHPDRIILKAEKQTEIENWKCQVDEVSSTFGLSGTESGSFDGDKSKNEDIKNERYEKQLIKDIVERLEKDFEDEKERINKVDWAKNSKAIAKEAAEHIDIYSTKSVRMEIPPDSTILKNESKKKVQLKASITSFHKSKKAVVEEVNIITIEAVKPLPTSMHWTYIPHNIREEDSKELTHYPNLEQLGLLPAHQQKFEEELFAAYGGKFRGDPPTRLQKLENNVFLNLVESVVKDTRLKFSKLVSPYESEELWVALSKAVDDGKTEAELKDRYESIQRKACPPTATDNLDDASESVEREQLKDLPMTSYTALFCRRCFIYDCLKHSENDHVDAKSYRQLKSSGSSAKEKEGKDSEMYSCQNKEKCWRNQRKYVMPTNDIMAAWKDSNELSLFRYLWESFGNQHCLIANTLMTKSCQQVHDLAVLLKMKSEQDEGYGSPGVTDSNFGPSSATNNVNQAVEYYPDKAFQVPIIPCKHAKNVPCNSKNCKCFCGINGKACEKYCFCPDDCPKRFRGCKCKKSCGLDKNCPCFSANRECDPDLCISCSANEYQPGTPGCGNVAMLRNYQPNILRVRESKVHQGGWGLFTFSAIKKGELIVEYRGEIISHDEGERRGIVYDMRQHTFLFTLNQQLVLDSTKLGNEARFINSSKKPNAVAKHMIVNADQRIGIYAKRDICEGEELSFDYHHVIKKKNGGCKSKE